MAAMDKNQDALVIEILSALRISASEMSWTRPIGAWLQQRNAEASAEAQHQRCVK
jgi:hypothetical protein